MLNIYATIYNIYVPVAVQERYNCLDFNMELGSLSLISFSMTSVKNVKCMH